MRKLWKWCWFVGVLLVLNGCSAAGLRFKAGVDIQLTKVVQDSTKTTSVTRSWSEQPK
jgi:hypothetical protein